MPLVLFLDPRHRNAQNRRVGQVVAGVLSLVVLFEPAFRSGSFSTGMRLHLVQLPYLDTRHRHARKRSNQTSLQIRLRPQDRKLGKRYRQPGPLPGSAAASDSPCSSSAPVPLFLTSKQ